MRFIYRLIDPRTNETRYIGQTDNLKRRYNDHVCDCLNIKNKTYHTHKSNWIRSLISNDLLPVIEVIEECDGLEQSNIREKYHIEKFHNEGCKLTNSYVSDVTEFSITTREKMSSAKKGKKLEEIVGEEKAEELKIYYSERFKVNNPNKNDDPLVREKISSTLKEYFSDKNNHWAYGKEMTDEMRENLRISHMNNPKNVGNRSPRTEEQKKKLSDSIKGREIKRSRILQFDLEDNLIKIWDSIREICRQNSNLNRPTLNKCINSGKNYANFKWIKEIEKN